MAQQYLTHGASRCLASQSYLQAWPSCPNAARTVAHPMGYRAMTAATATAAVLTAAATRTAVRARASTATATSSAGHLLLLTGAEASQIKPQSGRGLTIIVPVHPPVPKQAPPDTRKTTRPATATAAGQVRTPFQLLSGVLSPAPCCFSECLCCVCMLTQC